MTQFIITLEKDANATILKKMISCLKGVANIKVSHTDKTSSLPANKKKTTKKEEEMKKLEQQLHWLTSNFDSSSLDMNDERTKYIMRESK